jgi:hypothetical protein
MKIVLSSLLSAAVLLLASHTQAAVINFDDLATNDQLTSMSNFNPYGGFTWHSNFLLGDDGYSGYDNAAHSGSNFVNNRNARNLTVTGASLFDFEGAWFVAPNISGTKASWINISAYDAANALIGSTGNVAISNNYSFVAANFDGVARLNITADRGFWAMDDFTLAGGEVPEPGSVMLFGLGVVGLLASRRSVPGLGGPLGGNS